MNLNPFTWFKHPNNDRLVIGFRSGATVILDDVEDWKLKQDGGHNIAYFEWRQAPRARGPHLIVTSFALRDIEYITKQPMRYVR